MPEEVTITNHPDSQIKIVLFPERKIQARKDKFEQKVTDEIDIVELRLTDIDGNEKEIGMTPDEALEICGLLNTAVSFYMKEYNEEYKKNFTAKIQEIEKRRLKK